MDPQDTVRSPRPRVAPRDLILTPVQVVAEVDRRGGAFAHHQGDSAETAQPHGMGVDVDQVESLVQREGPEAHVRDHPRVHDAVEQDLLEDPTASAGSPFVK